MMVVVLIHMQRLVVRLMMHLLVVKMVLLEFAVVSGGSNEIVARIKNDGLFINTGNTLRFEGATSNAHETTLTVADPTADRTITLPNASGTVALTSDMVLIFISSDVSK